MPKGCFLCPVGRTLEGSQYEPLEYTIFKIWCKHRSDERALNNINVFNSFKTDMKCYLQIEITRNGSYIELSRLFIDNM